MKMSRREFLIGAAFAGGGLHLNRDWSFRFPAASDRVRVGVIAANIDATDLARYSTVPGLEVVALSDPSSESFSQQRIPLRAFAERLTRLNQPALYADWRSLIDRQDIDALFVAPPDATTQSKIAVAALDGGKHVLLERPGRSLDQLTTISNAAKSKRRLAAHSYGAQFIGVSDARSEIPSAIQGLTTARAQHRISVASNVSDPAAQHREFLLNPVAEFDYARGVLGVSVPSSISCVAMRHPPTKAITRAALRVEFGAGDDTKAIEIDIAAGYQGAGNYASDAARDYGSIVFAGSGSGFAVQSLSNAFFRHATWSNFVDCVRSQQPAELVAPVSELRDSLALLQLAEQPCTSGRTLFVK